MPTKHTVNNVTTISGRAHYALEKAQNLARSIPDALARAENPTSRAELEIALADLVTLGHHINERAARALEYMRLDGEG